jgi:hypothetical protein
LLPIFAIFIFVAELDPLSITMIPIESFVHVTFFLSFLLQRRGVVFLKITEFIPQHLPKLLDTAPSEQKSS